MLKVWGELGKKTIDRKFGVKIARLKITSKLKSAKIERKHTVYFYLIFFIFV